MGDRDDIAMAVLSLLGRLTERLNTFSRLLREQFPGCEIQDDLSVSMFASGPWVESYLELSWSPGRYLVWSFDLARDERGWFMRRSLSRDGDGGSEKIVDFDDVIVSSFDEITASALRLISELFELRAPFVRP